MSENLMSAEAPYIHSNYYNFKRFHRKNAGVYKGKTNSRLDERLAHLEKARDDLKKDAIDFLGGKEKKIIKYDTKHFVQLLKGNADAEEIDYGFYLRNFFQKNNYYRIIVEQINDEKLARLKKEFPEIEEKYWEGIDKNLSYDKILSSVLSNLEFFINSKEFQESILKDKLGIQEKLKGSLRSEKGKILKIIKSVTEKINEKYSSKGGKVTGEDKAYYEMIKKYMGPNGSEFREYLKKNCKQYSDEDFEKYYNLFMERIEAGFNGKMVGVSKTQIGGTRGEELFTSIMNFTDGGIEFTVSGNISQIKAEKKVQKILKEASIVKKYKGRRVRGLRDLGKQARFDIIIQNKENKKVTGVQSKNYNEMFSELFTGNHNTEQQIDIFTNNKDTNTLSNFIKELARVSNKTIDADSLSYALANLTWFSIAGSIHSGNIEPQTIDDPDKSILLQELGYAILDFLGVVYTTQFEVKPEFSSAFWLLENQYLVPTFVILDELIKIARLEYKSINSKKGEIENAITMSISEKRITPSMAKDLYKRKREAVGSFNNASYSETILKVGREKGKEIMNNSGEKAKYATRDIFLEFDLKNKFMTAFHF